MALSPEEVRAAEEYERRLKEEAQKAAAIKASRQKAQQAARSAAAPSQQNNRSKQINQAAMAAKPQQRQRGGITEVGDALRYVASGDWLPDTLNAGAAGINQLAQQLPDNGFTQPIQDFTQAVDDKILSADELNRYKQQKSKEVAQGDNLLDKVAIGTLANAEAVNTGIQAGVAIPATLAARLANQASPWADPPAIVKDSPIGQSLFEIAQVLTPTLLGGGIAGALGRGALTSSAVGLLGESAVETIPQDNFDDLIAGRTIASKFGEIAENQGWVEDGAQFAKELVEGKTINSQVLTSVVGLAQNFGINIVADKLIHYFGKGVSKALRQTDEDRVATILGKSSDDVDKSINNINEPAYSDLAEPHEVVDVDSAVPVSKPSVGNTSINEDALIRKATSGVAEDGAKPAGGNYFTNWSAITDESSLQRVMMEATATLRKLKDFPDDLKGVVENAAIWWKENAQLIRSGDDNHIGIAALNFADLTDVISSKQWQFKLKPPKDVDVYLREYAQTTEEGFLAASLVGEELGNRIQRLAAQAVRLEDNSIDFSDAIENILNLHDKLNLFLIPLRRGKRKWAVDGTLQQKQTLARLQDADIKGSLTKTDPLSVDAPAASFENIAFTESNPAQSLRSLWEAFQNGDDAAGASLKKYLEIVSYEDPIKVITNTTGLTKVLEEQLKKGNREAAANLLYFSYLSRAATQTASAASNIARLTAEPLGAIVSGERAYGLGQLVGGIQSVGDAWKVARKAFSEGRAANGAAKIDEEIINLAKQQDVEEGLYLARLKQLNETNANPVEKFIAARAHDFRLLSYHPFIHKPARFLLAADEMTKVLAANQVAIGRAYKEIAELGVKDKFNTDRIIQQHIKNVFRGGVKDGKIIDADVLALAKNITFQSDIPTDGNAIDNAFLAMKGAADNSTIWKLVSPFTKVSYNILETAARYEPTGAFRVWVPRYKAILNGEMGEVAQVQLKSQIAFGRLYTAMAATFAGLGFYTGVNSGSMPKQSFIIPYDNEDGYIAISYAKLEPFATLTSVIADVVNGFKNEVISEGDYEKFVSNIVFSLGMASFDKTFMTGMADFGSMFDAKNLSTGSLTGAANIASIPVPAVARMAANWAHPYQTIKGMEGNAWENFIGSWRSRAIGGFGNPILYDELTGKPIPTVATVGKGDNYWNLVIGSVLNEFTFAGKVVNAAKDDPIKRELNNIGFKHDSYSSIRTYGGIALSPDQQSVLSKDLHDFGNLRGKLATYFDSDQYKRYRREFQATRRADSLIGSSADGTRANTIRDLIFADIRTIYRQAKEEAVIKGRLANDASFRNKQLKVDGVSNLSNSAMELASLQNK
jgi:hypothetical protein